MYKFWVQKEIRKIKHISFRMIGKLKKIVKKIREKLQNKKLIASRNLSNQERASLMNDYGKTIILMSGGMVFGERALFNDGKR